MNARPLAYHARMSCRHFTCVSFFLLLLVLAACANHRVVRGSTDGGGIRDDGALDLGPEVFDGGGAIDAGPVTDDAGRMTDAGPIFDAAGATTCALGVTPLSGAETTDFVFTGASNGSMCSVSVDGGATLVVPCSGMLTYPGSFFGPGTHVVELIVAAGPSGGTRCMTSFTVAGSGATTCNVIVTPSAGPISTTFVANFDSNGTACTGSVDTLSIGAVSCVGTFSGMGSLIGVGTHTATLNVTAGPGGPTACGTMFTVTP